MNSRYKLYLKNICNNKRNTKIANTKDPKTLKTLAYPIKLGTLKVAPLILTLNQPKGGSYQTTFKIPA